MAALSHAPSARAENNGILSHIRCRNPYVHHALADNERVFTV